ncbi:MAG: DHA2 family efflux MFS transporter permease subunit [Solirubrobacterales bacterium]|nr:DHA2 family efflux MFS transporter permease subunit [Solirubrobacterales bacterium]
MQETNRRGHPSARWIALVAVCLGQLMSVLDATIVNVALPRIQHDLHFGQSSLTWVLNGYLLTFGSLLLLGGRLGDLVGRRRVFLAGVSLFTLASVACGIANSQTTLVVARFIQGVGGAGAVSAIVAIIASEFPSPRERAKAMSIYMLVVAGGASLGLIAGGTITQLLDWHWIFYINVPIGAFTILLGRAWISENRGLGLSRDVDVLGSALITSSLIAIVYAIVTSSSHGWGSAHTLGFGGAGLALMAAFVALESRLANPIMPLRVFRIRGLPSSSLIRGMVITGMFATFFIGVLYLEHIKGYGVLTTGLAFLAQTVVLAALSLGPVAWLVNRIGPRPPLLVGLVSMGIGLAVFGTVGLHTAYIPTILIAFVLMGAGAGLAFMPLLTIAMAEVPMADAGLASGIVNTSVQLSGAIGVAVLGTLSAQHTRALLAHGTRPAQALLGGYHLAFTVGVGCIAAALVAALLWARVPRAAGAEVLATADADALAPPAPPAASEPVGGEVAAAVDGAA